MHSCPPYIWAGPLLPSATVQRLPVWLISGFHNLFLFFLIYLVLPSEFHMSFLSELLPVLFPWPLCLPIVIATCSISTNHHDRSTRFSRTICDTKWFYFLLLCFVFWWWFDVFFLACLFCTTSIPILHETAITTNSFDNKMPCLVIALSTLCLSTFLTFPLLPSCFLFVMIVSCPDVDVVVFVPTYTQNWV